MNQAVVDEVFSTYEYIKDSMKVAKRTINRDLSILQRRTLFIGEDKGKVLTRLAEVESELDDIMVLSLFAAFERELRLFIQDILDGNLSKKNSTVAFLGGLTRESIERWTVADMIDAMKDVVDESTRGKAKQIYEYRNWVAHGKNKSKLPSIRTDPKTVQALLLSFMNSAISAQ
ncbi:MAG: hypothetical protein ACOYM2_16855 [Rectinemataceae bacterium]